MSSENEQTRMMRFWREVSAEWRRSQQQYGPLSSAHEAEAVIREEFEEFWEEVKRKQQDKTRMRAELVQVAAMCVRAVIDLSLEAVEAAEGSKKDAQV